MNYLITDENGRLVVSNQTIEQYDDLQAQIDELTNRKNELQKSILKEMLDNKVTTSKSGKYTISVVQPKDKEVFDSVGFIADEEVAIISLFTTVEDTEYVDTNKLKEQYPEAYDKCVAITHKPIVDVEKLQKSLPEVYKKYVTVIKTDKEPSIRFTGSKK